MGRTPLEMFDHVVAFLFSLVFLIRPLLSLSLVGGLRMHHEYLGCIMSIVLMMHHEFSSYIMSSHGAHAPGGG